MVQCFLSHPYHEIRELRTTVLPSLRHHLHFLPNDNRCLRSRNTLLLRPATRTAANISTAAPFPSYLDPLLSNELTLGLGEVHIWWLQHSSSSSPSSSSVSNSHVVQLHQACTALVTSEEASECAASKDEATRELRLLARAFSRSVLCRYLPVAESTVEENITTTTTNTTFKASSRIDPTSLLFQRNEHGKPELSHPFGTFLRFNLTHTPGLIGVAVTRDVSVGLDAEAVDRKTRKSALQLAKRRFSQLEIQQLERYSGDASSQAALFIKLWTLKEAFVKAVGRGISAAPGLKGFSFSFSEPPREGTLTLSFHQNSSRSTNNGDGGDGDDDHYGWEFALMQPTEGHLAAVCCQKQKAAVSTAPLKVTSFLASTAHYGGAEVHTAKILARGSTLEGDEE